MIIGGWIGWDCWWLECKSNKTDRVAWQPKNQPPLAVQGEGSQCGRLSRLHCHSGKVDLSSKLVDENLVSPGGVLVTHQVCRTCLKRSRSPMETPPVVTRRSEVSSADFRTVVNCWMSSLATPASFASKPLDLSSEIRVVLLLSLMWPGFKLSPGSCSSFPCCVKKVRSDLLLKKECVKLHLCSAQQRSVPPQPEPR